MFHVKQNKDTIMKIKELENLRYSNYLTKIRLVMSEKSFSIHIDSIQSSIDGNFTIPLVLCDQRGKTKIFRSSKSAYSMLKTIFSWTIHPELSNQDRLDPNVHLMLI